MLVLPVFHDLFTLPDPALRQPFTGAAFFPLHASYYVMAVLVILPHTVILRLSLLPFVYWQAWKCAFGLNFSAGLALSLGAKNVDRLNHWNFAYVIGVFVMALRATEWAFMRKPFRRYGSLAKDESTPVERPRTIPNVILDAFDLLCNQRGIGWSWGSKSFLRTRAPPPSLATVAFKLFFKLTMFDIAHCILLYNRPSLDTPAGDTLFDPQLDVVPRVALAMFFTICGGIVVYMPIDAMYHFATLVGRVVLRQPTTHWPPLSARPWMATSITDFWSFRWHQFFRNTFIALGARPGGALFGKPGALFGAFGVSALMHYVGLWGLGRGTEFSSASFFLLMAIGAMLERVWLLVTGKRVRGFWGWAWTMTWTIYWATFMMDGWARRGMFACDFFVLGLRPGKPIVDAIISLMTSH